jgi:hypothetical protein
MEVLTTSGTYPWSFVTHICHSGQPCHGGDLKNVRSDDFKLIKGRPWFSSFPVGNLDRNHKLWNIVSAERYILHVQVLLECCYISMEILQCEN